ncbi:MAG: GNAT family N-acetyltransferase [Pseudobacter sp.]|uniref:GNAT family N-acetyltransferase n=1 Tax=Pseudobacter sp. TaxID=2045420 RepID=UPI003F7EA7BF
MQIRFATISDLPSIYAFVCDLEEQTFDFELFQQYYRQNISEKNNIYLVAADNNNIPVGYISCHGQLLLHHLGMVFEIQEMFVDPLHRGQGIGHRLIEILETHLRERECRSLEVTTNAKREATQEFYAACGFTKSHVKFTKTW